MDARAEAMAKARRYLRTRGTLAEPRRVRDQVASALGALETLVADLAPEQAARRAVPGEWCVHEIVDHLVETYRPGLDELRCLLADRRPPGEPIPASLQSKAPLVRPWPWLLAELRRLNADVLAALDAVPGGFAGTARAPVVMVVNVPAAGGGFRPVHWLEELDWKAYSIVSWRAHTLDHIAQARKVLAA